MKTTIITHILAVIITVIICWWFWCRGIKVDSRYVHTETFVEKNSDKISNFESEVIYKNNTIYVKSNADSEFYGDIKVDVEFDRRMVQYANSISIGGAYLINSQMVLLNSAYTYKNVGIDAYVGYSFRFNLLDYGVGIKYIYTF